MRSCAVTFRLCGICAVTKPGRNLCVICAGTPDFLERFLQATVRHPHRFPWGSEIAVDRAQASGLIIVGRSIPVTLHHRVTLLQPALSVSAPFFYV